ncbi:unnamed protein product [Sphenostylis stenocarpa]|uniref:Uncharacterized protein n=1 Tax=Sphenostylis stenocarpa TaxID=92480 RepID=A0AA86TCM2_9FABA|nr:unnamed protein product [Sphenostylis stenocarpa]
MLDSVVEYITQAASSYAFIFCFCNLIIVIILVDMKPKLGFDRGSEEISLSMPTNTGIHGAKSKCLVSKSTVSPQSTEVGHIKEEVVVDRAETEGSYNCNCNSTDEDDELRRRVEEFIERVNEGWKAEYLS